MDFTFPESPPANEFELLSWVEENRHAIDNASSILFGSVIGDVSNSELRSKFLAGVKEHGEWSLFKEVNLIEEGRFEVVDLMLIAGWLICQLHYSKQFTGIDDLCSMMKGHAS